MTYFHFLRKTNCSSDDLPLSDGDVDETQEDQPITGVGGAENKLDSGDHFLSSGRTAETPSRSVDAPAQRPGCIFELARGDGRSPGG